MTASELRAIFKRLKELEQEAIQIGDSQLANFLWAAHWELKRAIRHIENLPS